MSIDVYVLTPEEMYTSFVQDEDPQDLMNEGRTAIASRLQVAHRLSQEDAFYAADEILTHAQTLIDLREQE